MFWLLAAVGVFIGSSHPLVCYLLLWFHMFHLDIAPSWWVGFLCEIMYFLTKLVGHIGPSGGKGKKFFEDSFPFSVSCWSRFVPWSLYSSTHPRCRIWPPLVVVRKPQPPKASQRNARSLESQWDWVSQGVWYSYSAL